MRSKCPYLPDPETLMSYRSLRDHPTNSPQFYRVALSYAQSLWLQGKSARSILAATRALYAPLAVDHAVYEEWPLPYAAIGWIVANGPSNDFPGNPRISFEHQAARIRGKNAPLLSSRAQATWAIIRCARPDLPGDSAMNMDQPDFQEIETRLIIHGSKREATTWCRAMSLWKQP